MKEAGGKTFSFKKSNIRIWIHHRDLANLQQVIWEGHGSKLLVEHSNNQKVRKFLECVPHIMGLIKDVHCDVLNNDVEALKTRTAPPVLAIVLSGKDKNGLTPLHKAAGLGHYDIVDHLLYKYPEAISIKDNFGRIPLHYAALAKDDNRMYDLLVKHGSDESVTDNKDKTPANYKSKPNELDPSVIRVVPDCPRTARESFLENWDWNFLTSPSVETRPRKTDDVKNKPKIQRQDSDVNDNRSRRFSDHKEETSTHEDPTENSATEESEAVDRSEVATRSEDLDKSEYTHDSKNEYNSSNDNGRSSTATQQNTRNNENPSPEITNGSNSKSNKDEDKKGNNNHFNNRKENSAKEKTDENKINHQSKPEKSNNEGSTDDKKILSSGDRINTSMQQKEISTDNETKNVSESKKSDNEESANNKRDLSNGKMNHSKRELSTENKSENVNENNKSNYKHNENNHKDNKPHENVSKHDSSSKRHNSSAITQQFIDSEINSARLSRNGRKTDPENKEKQHIQENKEKENGSNSNSNYVEGSIGVIEGVVNGENEVESVNEEGQGLNRIVNNDKDDEVIELVKSNNMEQLAALVLNGEGDRLIGHKSENPEIQAFLDNVPVYMSKIHRIHVAAKNGSLKDLQAALDRRKFAIAKDRISPDGATPLHVSVIFGNTSIVRYLAGRFPETVNTVDDNGRSPLHFAAVLDDNGHYYNLLVHLGADPNLEDNFNHTPEYYRTNRNELSHRSLLTEFGGEELAEEILKDKVPNDIFSAKKDFDDPDMLEVLEKCYDVIHGRKNSVSSRSSTQKANLSSLFKHLNRKVFDKIKIRMTKLDHNLYDVIWPTVKKLPPDQYLRKSIGEDFPAGVVAPDVYSYEVFGELLYPLVTKWHFADITKEVVQPPQRFLEESVDEDFQKSFNVDFEKKWVLLGTMECTRNLEEFELPKSLNAHQLEKVESMIINVLLNKEENAEEEDTYLGDYYSMNEVLEDLSEVRLNLAANGLLIPIWNVPNSDRLHGRYWPFGRGVYVNRKENVAVWVNVIDHLRIVTSTSTEAPANIGKIYSRVYRIVRKLDEKLNFKRNEKLGFLSARPTVLGNSLQFRLQIKFPHLIKEEENLKHLCFVRGLTYSKHSERGQIVKIANRQSLGVSEYQLLKDFTAAILNLLELEKHAASLTSSLHIAAKLLNVFRRKKADSENA